MRSKRGKRNKNRCEEEISSIKRNEKLNKNKISNKIITADIIIT